ncbi:MAG: response regulator [Leptospira sp.]|nr:response regulator [Leptospira sp.]
MNQINVLLVEDEAPTRNFLAQALISAGYLVTKAENGEEALQLYKKNDFPVILTDLEMPVMGGKELISKIIDLESVCPPMIIVLTSHDESSVIVEVMKKGVLDYLIKPANADEILTKVKFASKSYDLKRMQIILEKEKEIRLKEQLDWLNYKNAFANKEANSFNDNLIHNMRHNLGQSGGFGNLVSLLELIYNEAKKDGDEIRIDKEIFELLHQSVQMIDKTFVSLENISRISESEITLEPLSISKLYEFVATLAVSFADIAKVGSHLIILGDPKESFSNQYVNVNLKHFEEVIKELLINACKFSEMDSKIFIIFRIEGKMFHLSVVNEPKKGMPVLGVPIEYSNLVFEPFYRINKFIYENYTSLDLGLGLSMVRTIVQKMKGEISISNIQDFISLEAQNIRVDVGLRIPLA